MTNIPPEWNAVEEYVTDLVVRPEPMFAAALEASAAAGLPAINVTPNQGKFLELLARSVGARNILEIGTLGGYSTLWLARAVQAQGRVVTLEIDAHHAEVARDNFDRAGLGGAIELRRGTALDSLAALADEGAGPFDFIFIDADKANIPAYFAWSLRLSRAGSLILVDNVVRGGAVVDGASTDASVQGVRQFNEQLAAEPRVSATTLQTVGAKGYDGFTLVLVGG
jgi:predicted O-methyltransferase YrrM